MYNVAITRLLIWLPYFYNLPS